MKRAYLVFLLLCLTTTFLLSQSNPVLPIDQTASVISPITQVASVVGLSPYRSPKHKLPPELNPPGVLPHIRPGIRGPFSAVAGTAGEPNGPIFVENATYGSGGAAPSSIAVADVNGDGKPDVIVLNQCGTGPSSTCSGLGVVSVLLGNGDGTFQAAQSYDSGGFLAIQVVVGDMNGDGKPDLAVLNTESEGSTDDGSISILLGNGDGTFQPAQTLDSAYYPSSIAAGDVNGDGKIDLVVSYYCDPENEECSYGGVDVYLGNGDGTFQASVDYSSGGYITEEVILADMNGDGKPDLVVAHCGDSNCVHGKVGVLLGNGDGTFHEAQTYDSGGDLAVAVAVGDVNGDGKPDLVVSNYGIYYTEPIVSVLLGNGDGTLQPAQTYSSGSSSCSEAGYCPVSIGLKDVNGDGKLDAVVPYEVLLGNGDGTFQAPLAYSSGIGQFALADLNGDGRPDVSVANYNVADNVTIFLNVSPWPTVTSLVSSVNPSSYGQLVTFAATVTTRGKGTPTGTVQFLNGTTLLATLKLKSGTAKYTTAKLPVGSNVITTVYSGDSNNNGSTSAPVNQIVLAPTTTTLTSSPNPSAYGQAVLFTAAVTSSIGAPPDGETVTFKRGSTVLGTGTLSGGSANFSTSTLGVGTKALRAVYGGDASFAGSTSVPVSQVIREAASTTTLVSSLNPSKYGQSVTFKATVASQFSGTPTPTGTVVFKHGTKILKIVPLSGGSASYTTSKLATGTHNIIATYNGSSDFTTSSADLMQTVQKETRIGRASSQL